ncbi:MAG: FlgO family outer membrane protein [Spirochaetia bacterium]|nr:FlgO family outer membrane protein [Spirochaetia bacterium]
MKSRLKLVIAIIILISAVLSSCATNTSSNQTITIDDFYNRFISHITTKLSPEYDLKFAALSFKSTNENDADKSELGIYLAESLASQISMKLPVVTLFERENIEIILKEHDLNLSGHIDSEQAMEVGKLIPVNALLTGKYTILDNTVTINCRLIDVTTGEILIAYYDSVELTKDLSGLAGKEWVEEKTPEVSVPKTNTNKNNGSSFFSSTLKTEEEILPFEIYMMIAEDKQYDFSTSYGNGVSDDPAGDIEAVYYFSDDFYHYFLVKTYESQSLSDINVCFNFYFDSLDYDILQLHCNDGAGGAHIKLGTEVGDGEDYIYNPLSIDEDFLYRLNNDFEVRIPKSVFEKTPTSILVQTRDQRTREIDRIQIDSNYFSISSAQSNLREADPIIIGSKIGYKIAEKKITIDGNGRDWGNISPVYLSHSRKEGDDSKLIKAIYVARDDEYLYLRMDVLNDKPEKDETVYAFHVQNGDRWSKGDLELGYRVWDNIWRTQFNRALSDREWEGVTVPSSFGASGKIVEIKFPLLWITNNKELKIKPYIHIDDRGDTDSLDEILIFF